MSTDADCQGQLRAQLLVTAPSPFLWPRLAVREAED